MPCTPSENSIDVSDIPVPGVGTAPNFPDIPGLTIPEGFPEDLVELLERLSLILPSGILKPNLNANTDTGVLDVIIKLLDYLSVFLAMYKMILPILNMIICIIEVLCALINPIKLAKKLRRLFRVCIPEFLSLFPVFALILMIISLILLIIALIEYIIAQILRIINALLRNIRLLAKIIGRKDVRSALVALRKIGALLCWLQNVFIVLAIVNAIIDIIRNILKLASSIPPCDDSSGDDDGCCTQEVCPQFLRDGEYTVTTGTLLYHHEIGADTSALTLPPAFASILGSLGAVRKESWQFFDETSAESRAFYNITSAYDVNPLLEFTFFPQGTVYGAATAPRKVPYLLDIRLLYNPTTFGRVDAAGTRYVRIKNVIVEKTPAQSPTIWDNTTNTSVTNGVLSLVGGKVYEDDGTTAIMIDSAHATLNSLIHQVSTYGGTPINNGLEFTSVEYTFRINYDVLAEANLITVGCMPDVNLDKNTINTVLGAAAGVNFQLLANITYPDAEGCRECLTTALTKFRGSISVTSLATFQSETTACLNQLLDESKNALRGVIDLGVSVNNSTYTIDPVAQFTTEKITVTATLNDVNGLNVCNKIPLDVANDVAVKLVPEITLGEITDFEYDGESTFKAKISSAASGSGTIKLLYNGNYFSTFTIPADLAQTPSVSIQELAYSFIDTPAAGSSGTDFTGDGQPRRNEGDVARDGSSGSE